MSCGGVYTSLVYVQLAMLSDNCIMPFLPEWYLMLVDQVFLAIYIMELGLKVYVWRLRFFKQSWNIFGISHTLPHATLKFMSCFPSIPQDCAIVAASLVDFFIPLLVQNIGAFDAQIFRILRVFRAIRALRALRVLRTIRY